MTPDLRPFRRRDPTRHPPSLAPAYRSTVLRSPRLAPVHLPHTVSELSGPVFSAGEIGPLDHDLTQNYAAPGASALGSRILVHGRLADEEDRGIPGALIEIWQANAGGRYRHRNDGYLAPLDPNFGGCGRTITGEDGSYMFRTVMPGPYPWPNGPNEWRPAHIHFSVFGTAFVQRLVTQMYFEGDPHLRRCAIVSTLPGPDAVDSLVALLDMERTLPMDARAYRFDIVLRGRRQTAFETHGAGR